MAWIPLIISFIFTVTCKPPSIISLDLENYNTTINNSSNTFVLYHDNVKDSKRYMKEFLKACKLLTDIDDPLIFATFDVIKAKELRKQLNIIRFPMVVLHMKGKNQTYEGQRYGDKMAYWVEKQFQKTKPNYMVISSIVHKIEFEKKKEAMVVFFGKKEAEEFRIFEDISKKLSYLNLGLCRNKTLFKEYNIPKSKKPLMMIHHAEEGRIFFYGKSEEKWDFKDALHFVKTYSVPNMKHLNVTDLRTLRTEKEPIMVLLYSSAEEKHEGLLKLFLQSRYTLGGELLQGLVDIESEDGKGLLENLREKVENQPSIWIFNHSSTPMKKHKFEGNQTLKDIYIFFRIFQEGKLPTLWRSEPPPKINDGVVKTIVGVTFDEIVLNNKTDVILFLTDEDCKRCQKPSAEFKELASKYTSYENLIFGQMNAYHNEVEDLLVENIPKIMFFSRNNKEPVQINSLDTKKIEDFLRNNVWELRKVDKEL